MQPEIDYVKIGQRIKAARLEKGYSLSLIHIFRAVCKRVYFGN